MRPSPFKCKRTVEDKIVVYSRGHDAILKIMPMKRAEYIHKSCPISHIRGQAGAIVVARLWGKSCMWLAIGSYCDKVVNEAFQAITRITEPTSLW